MKQHYINLNNYQNEIKFLFQQLNVKNVFMVCGNSFLSSFLYGFIDSVCMEKGIGLTCFQEFSANPKYKEVQKGIPLFKERRYDLIIGAGGGSALDVAKCIKLFATMEIGKDYLKQEIQGNEIPFLAIPTTAGTGSEATQFAVIYVNNEKHSVEHESILPSYVLLYPDSLKTLSCYQKKITVCDALSHAIESYWSIHSTPKSKRYSEMAIKNILAYMEGYLENDVGCNEKILFAANWAGRAINITKTTAAHAMCYKLTALLDIPHGHAVMLCLPEVWEYMNSHIGDCIDVRGQQFLQESLETLAHCLGQSSSKDAIQFLKQLRSAWNLNLSIDLNEEQKLQLINSVNAERLSNFPVTASKENLKKIYQNILA